VQEIKRNGRVCTIGILFIPCFVKIGQLVLKLKLTLADIFAFSESFHFRKEGRGKGPWKKGFFFCFLGGMS
jgi:hypothetical protein